MLKHAFRVCVHTCGSVMNITAAKDQTSSYPGWIKSPHVVTCHTYFPGGGGGGGNLQLKNHKVPRSA